MTRAALSLLLRLAETDTSQLLSSGGHLTKLQSILLQAAGHVGFTPFPSAQSLSQLGWTPSCTSSASYESIKHLSTSSQNQVSAYDQQEAVGAASDAELAIGSVQTRARRQKRIHFVDVVQLTLPRRARQPGDATWRRAAAAAAAAAAPGRPGQLTTSMPPSSHHDFLPPDVSNPTLTPPFGSPSASPTPTSDASSEVTDPGGDRLGRQPTLSMTRTTTTTTTATTTTATSSSSDGDSAAPLVKASRSAFAAAAAGRSGSCPDGTLNTLEQLLDALEAGAALPPPRMLFEAVELWRNGRKQLGVEKRRTALEDVRKRLDRVLPAHLRKLKPDQVDARNLAMLFWSLTKSGLVGETTLAIVEQLEGAVRPDMPYRTSDYWGSLALYSLGVIQQVVTAGGGGAAAGRPSTAAALVRRSQDRLAPALLQLMARHAATINLQALSNTIWAAGLLRLTDAEALRRLAAEAHRRADTVEPQNLANIIYGCALMGLSKREWASIHGPQHPFIERLLDEAVRRRLEGFKPMEVSCTTWAACKLGLEMKPLLEAVADYIGRGGFDGGPSLQVWANTLYAMALDDFYDPRVFRKLSRALVGAAASSSASSSAAAAASYASASSAAMAAAVLRGATAQTCGNILLAMGLLRHLDEAVVEVLMGRLAAVTAAGRASVVDMALAVRACAQLNYRPPSLDVMLAAVMPTMRAQAHRLMAYNVLWSLLTLDMLAEPRHQPLIKYLVSCVNQYGTDTWKSAATAGDPAAAAPAAAPPPAEAVEGSGGLGTAAAYDDLTQLVQYHLESHYLGLTGDEYDLKPPQGMDAVVRQIRARRQYLAAKSSTVVHQYVLAMLKDMAASSDGSGDGTAGDTVPPYPRILSVESEVMVEPELIVVDVLLTLERPMGHTNTATTNNNNGLSAEAQTRSGATAAAGAGTAPPPPWDAAAAAGTTALGASSYKLALEVDGPFHFMRNRPEHTDGPSAYRDRVLRRRFGPRGVVVVPTATWVERLRDDGERRKFLAELLAGTATEAETPQSQPKEQK